MALLSSLCLWIEAVLLLDRFFSSKKIRQIEYCFLGSFQAVARLTLLPSLLILHPCANLLKLNVRKQLSYASLTQTFLQAGGMLTKTRSRAIRHQPCFQVGLGVFPQY